MVYDIIVVSRGGNKMIRLHRRVMRNVARFILGFDNCPIGCRKDYKSTIVDVISAFLLCAITIALFGALAINC